MSVAVIVLSAVLALILGVGVVGALLNREPFAGNLKRLRVTPAQRLVVLTAEAAAVIGLLAGLWWVPLNLAAAVGVVALMVGALGFHWRVRDPASEYGFAVAVLAMSAGLAALQVTG
ncbi:MAG TPA: DoxX family protein [Pseudonocardia sp.]|nr:DoxX family protein [Pseudonocardia sp.]